MGKFRIETPENVLIDEFICIGSRAFSLKCGIDNKNTLKGISKSQSKTIKLEKDYSCLFGREYKKECDTYIIQSINHQMCLQKVCISKSSAFEEKRC